VLYEAMLQNPVGSALPTNVYLPVPLKVYVRDPPDFELKMDLERSGCHLWMIQFLRDVRSYAPSYRSMSRIRRSQGKSHETYRTSSLEIDTITRIEHRLATRQLIGPETQGVDREVMSCQTHISIVLVRTPTLTLSSGGSLKRSTREF
jgi:hypothetical protein